MERAWEVDVGPPSQQRAQIALQPGQGEVGHPRARLERHEDIDLAVGAEASRKTEPKSARPSPRVGTRPGASSRPVLEGETGAAALLGQNPSTLRSRIRKHGIRRPERRPPADPPGREG